VTQETSAPPSGRVPPGPGARLPTSFRARLVAGEKAPYTNWVFIVIPERVHAAWGKAGPWSVRGTLALVPFRRGVAKGEGVYRMAVPRELRAEADVEVGDEVEVVIELDPEPGPLHLPDELRSVIEADPELAAAFDRLAPSMRRAWAVHVGSAKRPATRQRRVAAALEGIPAARWPR